LAVDLYLDESILKNDKIAFNAGLATKSFIMTVKDYLKLIDPIICSFAKQSLSRNKNPAALF